MWYLSTLLRSVLLWSKYMKYMSRRCWRNGDQNPHGVLSHDDLEVLLKSLLMSIYSHCSIEKTITLKNNYIFLSCWTEWEKTRNAQVVQVLSSVQHKRHFCCFHAMILWPHCGLGNYKRAYFTIPISVSMNDCTHESASVSASRRVFECAFSQQHSQNAGNLGN